VIASTDGEDAKGAHRQAGWAEIQSVVVRAEFGLPSCDLEDNHQHAVKDAREDVYVHPSPKLQFRESQRTQGTAWTGHIALFEKLRPWAMEDSLGEKDVQIAHVARDKLR
jgi:hypothetical protein